MVNLDSPEFAAYLLKRDQTLYGRLLLNRFFVGSVVAVSGTGPWLLQVIRVGELASNGHWYNCSVPGYTPRIGDQVVLVWLTNDDGQVLAPLASTVPPLVSQMARLTPSVSVGTAVASVSFSSIPANFTHLWCSWRARSTSAGATTLLLRLNGDSAANYNFETVETKGTTTTTNGTLNLGATSTRVGGLGITGQLMAAGHFYIYDYARTGNRRMLSWYGWRNDSGGTGVEHGASDWQNTTDAVNSLTFLSGSGNLDAGCLFTLYGI